MQQLKVEMLIKIPEEYVLIKKIELEELRNNELTGVFWSMKNLEERVIRKSEWIKDNILYPSRFRNILDVERGGFVFYPKLKGQSWSFHAARMADFLDKNFSEIFRVR